MPENRNSIKIILLAALVSGIAAFALYLPSLAFDFVNWDDHLYVYENPSLRGPGLKWAFTSVIVGTWIPLTFLSFILDHAIWGLDPLGYHLTNTALHAANVFLLSLLAARLAGARGGFGAKALFMIALSAGLLFGLHPLRVESVAWVSERKDVLNAFFFLLGIHAYLSYARSRKALSYALTLAFFVLSLLSKPMTVTMPLVLLILDYYPLDRFRKEGWRGPLLEKLPFLALSLANGLITVWSQSEAMVTAEGLVFSGRLHVAARGYLFYVYKTLFPVYLAPFYPRNFTAGIDIIFAAYLLALSAITALAVYIRKRSGVFLSVWAYFIITLLPVIGLLQVGMQAAADRYTYIPGMGFAVLVAAGAGWAATRKKGAFAPLLAAVIAISALFSFTSFRQTLIWKDSLSLWERQVRVFPEHPKGYVNRGRMHLVSERFDMALNDFNKGIALDPFHDSEVYLLRSSAFINTGRFEEAIADLALVITSAPGNKDAYKARGTAYAIAGQYGNALEDFRKAVKIDPTDSSAHIDLGKAYMHLGDYKNSYISMKKAHDLGDPAAYRYIKDLEAWGPGPGE